MAAARQAFRKKLREGQLDEQEIEIELTGPALGVEIMAPARHGGSDQPVAGHVPEHGWAPPAPAQNENPGSMRLLTEEEAARLINDDDLKAQAVERVEQHGIVFLDEIDKIAGRSEARGPDVSREGVQRDLLPLVEGSTVSTKYGMVQDRSHPVHRLRRLSSLETV